MATRHRLLHDLILHTADAFPDRPALTSGPTTFTYGGLADESRRFAGALRGLGVRRGDRIAVWLDKRRETVSAKFGTSLAGGVFVPLNPVLKPRQVGHILQDCEVSYLVTTSGRLEAAAEHVDQCAALKGVVLVDGDGTSNVTSQMVWKWGALTNDVTATPLPGIDSDVAAVFYTSGSTGRPKGVVLSHRNLVVGAESVAQYLGNHGDDVILAALPLAFDAGFSQVTTAFSVGARVVLLNYLFPSDILKAMVREQVTGLTGVPTLWIQTTELEWPAAIGEHLRYVANTGGKMPGATLAKIRQRVPDTDVFLMYGLTEAFRATYLPPSEVDIRPDSIGKAIPNSEVLVLRDDGTPCPPGEPGELVQRGALVSLGYWNDPERTAERFRALPPQALARQGEVVIPETVVFSGDLVRKDDEGYLYFVSRKDEMMKTSGYRVSPTEVEEVLYASGIVSECAAFGRPDETLGQAIEVVVKPVDENFDEEALLAYCRRMMPIYMVPTKIHLHLEDLPRNQNDKIDRKALASALTGEATRSVPA